MANETFLSIRYEEYTDRYYTDLYVNNVAKSHKYLTNHEAEALSAYLHYLHDGKQEIVDVSVAEIVEQIEDGDILLDEESNLYQMLERTRT